MDETAIALELIPDDDPRLRAGSEVINPHTAEFDLSGTISAMFKLMWEHNGIGLAAPQVGINRRFFIMERHGKAYVCINPRILKKSKEEELGPEGCLSFPGVELQIPRAKEIRVSYQTLRGQRVEKKFRGIMARCFQHELDHLDGIVFTDKVEQVDADV